MLRSLKSKYIKFNNEKYFVISELDLKNNTNYKVRDKLKCKYALKYKKFRKQVV